MKRLLAPLFAAAFVVVYKGRIVAERYMPGITKDTPDPKNGVIVKDPKTRKYFRFRPVEEEEWRELDEHLRWCDQQVGQHVDFQREFAKGVVGNCHPRAKGIVLFPQRGQHLRLFYARDRWSSGGAAEEGVDVTTATDGPTKSRYITKTPIR